MSAHPRIAARRRCTLVHLIAPYVLGLSLCLSPATLFSQQLRGAVRDSTTERLILGAVVTLLDSAGSTRARGITNERGQFSFPLTPEIRSLRVQRIGFRARTVAVPASRGDVVVLNVTLAALVTMLAPTEVVANHCPRRADNGAAASLLEQARTGLLAAVVARESSPSSQLRIKYRRAFAGTSTNIIHQEVSVDDAYGSASFASAFSADDFVKHGFVEKNNDKWTYHAPDADVLLDDNFIAAYCFELAKPEASRPNQVGLAFRAARAMRDRVDVEGALWVDTLKRTVREITFEYRGLSRAIEALKSGGTLGFRELASGIVLIDEWTLRLASSRVQSATMIGNTTPSVFVSETYNITETGGQLARATWPDGQTWEAPLGTLQLTALNTDVSPAQGVVLKLPHTDYGGTTDSAGRLTVRHLIPGPYSVVAKDHRLEQIGVDIETRFKFVAVRDSIIRATVTVPRAEEFVADGCGRSARQLAGADSSALIAGRLTGGTIQESDDWQVVVSREVQPGRWERVGSPFGVRGDGLFFICSPLLRRGMTARIELKNDGELQRTIPVLLNDALTILNLPIPR